MRQDLRLAWMRLGMMSGSVNWDDVPGGSDYATAITAFVRDELRLCERGEPSNYFLHEIHDLVRLDHRQPRMVRVQAVELATVLGIKADTFGSASVHRYIRDLDGQEHEELSKIGTGVNAFADWDELRAEAHAQLDRAIDDLRRQMHDVTGTMGMAKRVPANVGKNMPSLVAWLWDCRDTGDLSAKQRRRLLDAMHLDSPTLSRQNIGRKRAK
ncbi:MAG: hypothetical protein QM753_12095 [Thermomicrobiales bacterium]